MENLRFRGLFVKYLKKNLTICLINELCKRKYYIISYDFSIKMSVVYIFAAELFPTEVRNIGIGFGSMVGRIGSVVAPFIILLQDFEGLSFLPYVIFGICGIISGLWALWLPDTTGKPILQEIFKGI